MCVAEAILERAWQLATLAENAAEVELAECVKAKRARDEELAKRKDDAKRPRTEAPSRDEVSTPSPHESDPIHTVI